MTEHALAQEQIASYLADGLDAAERGAFEAHVASCPECTHSLEECRAVDARLTALFIGERPRPGLEDRLIRGLRTPAPTVRRSMPLAGWIGIGAAATVAVGMLGAGMVFMIESVEEGQNARVYRESQVAEQPRTRSHGIVDRSDSMSVDESVVTSLRTLNGYPDAENSFGSPVGGEGRGAVRLLTADELALSSLQASKKEAGDRGRSSGGGKFVNEEIGGMPRLETTYYKDKSASREKSSDTSKTLTTPTFAMPVTVPPPPPVPKADPAEGYGNPAVPGKDNAFDPFRGGKPADMKWKEKSKEEFAPAPKPDQPNVIGDGGVPGDSPASRIKIAEEETPKPKPSEKVKKPPEKTEESPAEKPAAPKEPEKNAPEPATAAAARKIIRTGEIEFEVDSFDTSVERITKIAGEEKGFIATINSQKLENGKVRGSVVVRCPPERLDTLLLKLRALGDLKTQRIGSRDVGKEYTDTESELKANRAMEQRFLDIIKNGKGEIKDLIQAEKQLGEYRTRIEKLEGELRYLNNQIGLSTLTISLTEREIRAAAGITESSSMSLGLEVEDVDKSQQQAHAAITEAKGRILRSELKQNGPGMFEAVIKFQVPPEQVAGLREKLVKLGTVMRQDVGRKYAAEGGTERLNNTKVTREDAVFLLSLLNSANFAPRERVELQLACADAEAVYRSVLDRANKAGARIVSQAFDRQPNDQSQGTIRFEVKSAEADAVSADLKALGEVMRLQVVENVDPGKGGSETLSQAKRGFVVQLQGMGTTLPRETATIQAATRDVPASFKSIKDAAAKAKARILNATLNEQDRQNVSAQIDVEIRRANEADLSAALAAAGDVLSRNITRAADNQPNIIDSKIRWQITLINQVNIKPREVWTLAVEVPSVDSTASDFTAAVLAAKGRTIDTSIDHQRNGQVTARLVFDVPFDQAAPLADKFRSAGTVRLQQAVRNPQVPEGSLSIARIDVTLSNALLIVPSDQGIGLTMRKAVSYSLTALSYVLMFIVMGLIVVVPVVALGLGIRWTVLKLRGQEVTPVAPAAPAPPAA